MSPVTLDCHHHVSHDARIGRLETDFHKLEGRFWLLVVTGFLSSVGGVGSLLMLVMQNAGAAK